MFLNSGIWYNISLYASYEYDSLNIRVSLSQKLDDKSILKTKNVRIILYLFKYL